MIAILHMVLISIQPFAFKRIFLLVALLVCLSSAICLADSLLLRPHAARCDGQLHSMQAPVPMPLRTVEPPSPLTC